MAGAGFACLLYAVLHGCELLLMEALELCRQIREGKSHPKHPFVVEWDDLRVRVEELNVPAGK